MPRGVLDSDSACLKKLTAFGGLEGTVKQSCSEAGLHVKFIYKIRGLAVPEDLIWQEVSSSDITADDLIAVLEIVQAQDKDAQVVIALFLGYLNRNTIQYKLSNKNELPRYWAVQLSAFTVTITSLAVVTLISINLVLYQLLNKSVTREIKEPSDVYWVVKYLQDVAPIRQVCLTVFVVAPVVYIFLFFVFVRVLFFFLFLKRLQLKISPEISMTFSLEKAMKSSSI